MSIALPTQPTIPVTDFGKLTILTYGAPKAGKSTLASKFPKAVFFECEPGLNHLSVFKVPTYRWEDFLEACKLIAKGDHDFKTIVIDTVDKLLSAAYRERIDLEKIRSDLQDGAPVNVDGTINLVHYSAWQAKEMGRGE